MRLTLFTLVDTSGKMQGDRIKLVNKKIIELISNLRQDPCALETVDLCMASYDMGMRLCLPLTELASGFNLPIFEVRPSSSSMLGNALSSITVMIEKPRQITKEKGYFRLALYIFTGGKPSDVQATRHAMEQLLSRWSIQICFGLTSSDLVSDYENLFRFQDSDIVMSDLSMTNEYFGKEIFNYIERSIRILPLPHL